MLTSRPETGNVEKALKEIIKEAENEKYVNECQCRVERMLKFHWPKVEALGKDLLDRKRLTGRQAVTSDTVLSREKECNVESKKKQKDFMGKNIEVLIELFEIMYAILKENKRTETEWAEASGLAAERISEYKRKVGKTKTGAIETTRSFFVGRRLTLEKSIKLGLGLRKIVGAIEFKRGLIKELGEKELPISARVFMRLLVFSDDEMRQVDTFTDLILRSSEPSP